MDHPPPNWPTRMQHYNYVVEKGFESILPRYFIDLCTVQYSNRLQNDDIKERLTFPAGIA